LALAESSGAARDSFARHFIIVGAPVNIVEDRNPLANAS
jgi:hypothetical protein